MACGGITSGSTATCPVPAGGTRPRAIVYNYDEIESYTEVNGVITAINLVDGAFGYEFTGFGNSFKKSETIGRSAATGLATYKHSNTIVLYERTQEQKDNLTDMGNGKFVIVLFNNGLDDDSIELAGKNVGLKIAPGTLRDMFANDGLFVLSLATPEGEVENETAPMQTVFVTSREATISMLEATLPTS